MAYLDYEKAAANKAAEDKFKELKKVITSMDQENKLHEFFLASVHIARMEAEIEDQKARLLKYQHFFATLKGLLPKDFDMFTPIN